MPHPSLDDNYKPGWLPRKASFSLVTRGRRAARVHRGRVRRALLFGLSALALLGALAAFLVVQGKLFRTAASYRNVRLQRDCVTLSPHVHLLGRLVPSVAYAIETSDGLVLVDSGLDADGSRVQEQLAELRLDPSRIRAILLTHVHGDHTQGARYLRAATGATIFAGQGDCEPLRDGGPHEAIFSTFPMEGFTVHGTPVDVELKGGEVLEFGDTKIEVIATPGHTPGSMCYLLQRDQERALFGGDTISSLIGDLGTYSAYLAPRFRGNARDYLQSLRKIKSIPTPDMVLPGHPNEEGQPHSPRLSQAEWHSLLDRGIQDMETLVARLEADGEDFLDGQPKQLLTGLYYLGEYRERAVFVLCAGEHQVLFDASGDPGLAAFVARQLRAAGVDSPALTEVLLTSADAMATAGLKKVLETWPCRVIASRDAHSSIRAACGDAVVLMTPDELVNADWLKVRAIPLAGCGSGAVAYQLQWDQRDVLVSGIAPGTSDKKSSQELAAILTAVQENSVKYMDSLAALHNLRPNLWLPAYPSNGQNANLYNDQWSNVLERNRRLLGTW